MLIDFVPDLYISHNWFDVSYDFDYSISERSSIMQSLYLKSYTGWLKLGVL